MEETSRLPEGIEWPRYESGDLVMFGDCVENRNGTCTVNSVRFYSGGGVTVYGEGRGSRLVVVTEPVMRDPIRKARPKVFAADGKPLEVGQTVWEVDTEVADSMTVVDVAHDLTRCEYTCSGGKVYRPCLPPERLTHHRPVLDADGVPIHEGDTVWNATTSAGPFTVREIERSDDPDEPEDIVWCGEHAANGFKVWRIAGQLTHTKPEIDSWSSVWADVSNGNETPEGMMRRCRALAERGQ